MAFSITICIFQVVVEAHNSYALLLQKLLWKARTAVNFLFVDIIMIANLAATSVDVDIDLNSSIGDLDVQYIDIASKFQGVANNVRR